MIKSALFCATLLLLPIHAFAEETPCTGFQFSNETAAQSEEFWVKASDQVIKACITKHGIDVKSEDGAQPLNLAAYYRKTSSIVEYLLQSGSTVDNRSETGQTPLVEAAFGNGSSQTLALLIDAGADVNALNNDGQSPLLIAAAFNPRPVDLRVLIEAGADLEAPAPSFDSGGTPLGVSVQRNRPIITKLLTEAGADLDALNDFKQTPFSTALTRFQDQHALVLLRAGANPNLATPAIESVTQSLVRGYDPGTLPIALLKEAMNAGLNFELLPEEDPVMDTALHR
ncbi:ankyrin repeat domain-containing protein [Parasedimentitalea huanghaiensis]|uniref:ankyrin repeat domain-containing protein n=1 Tax=Parasedimentitalea huanghaiensis TaxID=2682100 RepID=UPI0012ED1634